MPPAARMSSRAALLECRVADAPRSLTAQHEMLFIK
jgi:hypothetical protein